MSSVLITYATNSGSTAEVAAAVAETLRHRGHEADSIPAAEVDTLEGYDAVVVGAPMILGWHKDARRFVHRHREQLLGMKTAYFACAVSLTRASEDASHRVPLHLDPNLVTTPKKGGSLPLKERFTSLGHYLKPILGAAPDMDPVSVAFFNGKLDLTRLKWWQALFVMAVVQAVPGDYRDWNFIRTWTESLAEIF